MRKISKIIVHCSDSKWGNAAIIREWHLDRNFADIGYHWIVLNGFPETSKDYIEHYDGLVELGRPESKPGAHCRGQNHDSIGICLIGVEDFTPKQFDALERIVRGIQATHGISDGMVFGHRDFDKKKTCPNFDVSEWMNSLRELVQETSTLEPVANLGSDDEPKNILWRRLLDIAIKLFSRLRGIRHIKVGTVDSEIDENCEYHRRYEEVFMSRER